MTLYGEREDAVRPVLQIAMPRSPRIYAPGGRCMWWLGAIIASSTSPHRRILRFCWIFWGRWVEIRGVRYDLEF